MYAWFTAGFVRCTAPPLLALLACRRVWCVYACLARRCLMTILFPIWIGRASVVLSLFMSHFCSSSRSSLELRANPKTDVTVCAVRLCRAGLRCVDHNAWFVCLTKPWGGPPCFRRLNGRICTFPPHFRFQIGGSLLPSTIVRHHNWRHRHSLIRTNTLFSQHQWSFFQNKIYLFLDTLIP